MTYQPGPKELALKALKEQKHASKGKKPSTSDLRAQIAKTQGAKKIRSSGRKK
jgi:hypothetical protein